MSAPSIQWSKPQRERAKATKETLWAAGYDGPKGRIELTGMMPDESALALIRFARELYQGHRDGLSRNSALIAAVAHAMHGNDA